MGRMKFSMKKIENKIFRQITFSKRKSGLVKKAYELSTLCDVELALIIFSPAGKLFLFEGKKSVAETLQRFIESPVEKRGRVANEVMIREMIAKMSLEPRIDHQYFSAPSCESSMPIEDLRIDPELEEVQKQIIEVSHQLQDVESELDIFLKDPTGNESPAELDFRIKLFEDTLRAVRMRKKELEAESVMQPTDQETNLLPESFANPSEVQAPRPETVAPLFLSPPSRTHRNGKGVIIESETRLEPDQVASSQCSQPKDGDKHDESAGTCI